MGVGVGDAAPPGPVAAVVHADIDVEPAGADCPLPQATQDDDVEPPFELYWLAGQEKATAAAVQAARDGATPR